MSVCLSRNKFVRHLYKPQACLFGADNFFIFCFSYDWMSLLNCIQHYNKPKRPSLCFVMGLEGLNFSKIRLTLGVTFACHTVSLSSLFCLKNAFISWFRAFKFCRFRVLLTAYFKSLLFKVLLCYTFSEFFRSCLN